MEDPLQKMQLEFQIFMLSISMAFPTMLLSALPILVVCFYANLVVFILMSLVTVDMLQALGFLLYDYYSGRMDYGRPSIHRALFGQVILRADAPRIISGRAHSGFMAVTAFRKKKCFFALTTKATHRQAVSVHPTASSGRVIVASGTSRKRPVNRRK